MTHLGRLGHSVKTGKTELGDLIPPCEHDLRSSKRMRIWMMSWAVAMPIYHLMRFQFLKELPPVSKETIVCSVIPAVISFMEWWNKAAVAETMREAVQRSECEKGILETRALLEEHPDIRTLIDRRAPEFVKAD